MTKGAKVTTARAKQQARRARQARQARQAMPAMPAIKIRESKPPKLTLSQRKTHATSIFTSSSEDPDANEIYGRIYSLQKNLLDNLLAETEDDLEKHYDDYFKNPLEKLFNEIVTYLNKKHVDYNITNEAFETEEEWEHRLPDKNRGVFLRLALASYSGSFICDTSRPDKDDDSMYFANTFENSAYGENRLVLDITPTTRKLPKFDVRKLENPPSLSVLRNPASIRALTNKDGIGHVIGFSVSQQEVVQTSVSVMGHDDMVAGYLILKLSNLKADDYDL
uniref:Uncharacterized protein n=1 Tax=viral metagenome TaxID=1070528 RepID=A0A6C0F3G9_9ZZZZ